MTSKVAPPVIANSIKNETFNSTRQTATPLTLPETVPDSLPGKVSGESLKVLITRPKAKAQQLALLLNEQGIANTSQTLFDYHPNACANDIASAIKNAEILIFVSAAAVEFTHASYSLTKHLLNHPANLSTNHSSIDAGKPPQLFVAVGNATKQALLTLGVTNIISPPPEQEHSEGLLKLPLLANVVDKNILIIRGNGGREHIANTLRKREANVIYLESYQRVWRTLAINIADQWREQQINCIVVTSNDILLVLIKYLISATGTLDDYWLSQCQWIVVSERIEKSAKDLGLTRVINTRSANSQILCNTLKKLCN